MKPKDFEDSCKELLGAPSKVWRKKFQKLTGKNASTITRYLSGDIPIPTEVQTLLFSLKTLVWYGDDINETFELGENKE